jgi:outer membrane protein TolC
MEASERRVRSARALYLPALSGAGNLQYWDKPLDVPVFGGMGTFRAREQLTWQVTATLTQPVSGLVVIGRQVALESRGAQAARADELQARLDTAKRASEAYLQLLQAKALAAVADKALTQVEAQHQRAESLERAGVLGKVDVLRLTSARANARQAVLQTRAGITVAGAALTLALGLDSGTVVDAIDDLPDPPPPVIWREADVERLAAASRPELGGTRARAEQARFGRSVALARLLPNINAVATAQHIEGVNPLFQPKNAAFIGGVLSWDIWDWGKNWNAAKEAEARANQAAIATDLVSQQVAFEAQRSLLGARTAFETLGVARTALEAAEEAYRIQSIRYGQGATTTTDVIVAEADVSRARSGYAQARYDYYLAQTVLARAVGRLPSADPGRSAPAPASGGSQ